MKERTLIKSVLALLVVVVILATRNTDLIYIGATALFFIVCIAYAEWCGRL